MSRCVYVSFYTSDYAEPAANLSLSLDAYNLDYQISRLNDSGRWILNCAQKPKFIRTMMDRYPDRPIVWTDADSVVRKYPAIFEDGESAMDADVAVCAYEWRNGKKETFSGTLLVNPNLGAREFVDTWATLQKANPEEMDQRVLAQAVAMCSEDGGTRIGLLPVEYCFITDMHRYEHPFAEPVFEHFQHSRIRKQKEVAR